MIKSIDGEVNIEGTRTAIAADFCCIVQAMTKNKLFDKDDFENYIKIGMMDKDDLSGVAALLFLKTLASAMKKKEEEDGE